MTHAQENELLCDDLQTRITDIIGDFIKIPLITTLGFTNRIEYLMNPLSGFPVVQIRCMSFSKLISVLCTRPRLRSLRLHSLMLWYDVRILP